MAIVQTNPKATCKFRVSNIEIDSWQDVVTLSTEYDPEDPEDTKFSAATPWGELKFGLSNPNLRGAFEVGQVFYLDLVPVEGDPRAGRII